jgi:hypothetical protein
MEPAPQNARACKNEKWCSRFSQEFDVVYYTSSLNFLSCYPSAAASIWVAPPKPPLLNKTGQIARPI